MPHTIRDVLPPVELALLEQLLRMLSSGQRLEILRLLACRPCFVNELAEELFQNVGAVSRDLSELRRCGLIHRRIDGTRRQYSLTDRVQVHRSPGACQVAVTTTNGDWLLAHAHSSADAGHIIEPPLELVGSGMAAS